MPRLRLPDGHHLYPDADGQWLLYGPEQTFIRIQAPAAEVACLASLIADALDADSARTRARELGVEAMLEEFLRHGMLRETDDAPELAPPAAPFRARVFGRGALADAVTALLNAQRLEIDRDRIAPTDLDGLDLTEVVLIVDLAEWQPERRWHDLDRHCVETGTAWLGAHHEADRLFVGPLFVPERGPRYRDLSERRLASADHPEALLSYFRYLEAGVGVPPPLSRPAVARIAGALAALALTRLDGDDLPTVPRQWQFDGDGRLLAEHPILPIPRGTAT